MNSASNRCLSFGGKLLAACPADCSRATIIYEAIAEVHPGIECNLQDIVGSIITGYITIILLLITGPLTRTSPVMYPLLLLLVVVILQKMRNSIIIVSKGRNSISIGFMPSWFYLDVHPLSGRNSHGFLWG